MMHTTLLLLVSILLGISFLMLMQTRVIHLIKSLVTQNIVLTVYILLKTITHPSTEVYLSLSLTFLIKVILLPWVLWRLTKHLKLSYIEPLVNKATLQLAGIFLVVFALLLSHQIESVVGENAINGFSLALANTLLSVLLIIARQKTISQILGLLVMENSIFLLSATLTSGLPWLIELGIGFDVLIGLMICGLFLTRIQATYGSLHTHHLEKLKG